MKKIQIGVIGSAGPEEYSNSKYKISILDVAQKVGFYLACEKAIVVTGGKGGVMESAARGAKSAGGTTVGVISGARGSSNKYTDIEVRSGMQASGMDELTLVLMCDAVIVIGGGAGTLQEITIAYRNNIPIVTLPITGGWSQKVSGKYLDERKSFKIRPAQDELSAVKKAIRYALKNKN